MITTLLPIIISLMALFVSLKVKSYIRNNNLFTFNNSLIDAKKLFLSELQNPKPNPITFNFANETLLNTVNNGCYFYYKNHYDKNDFSTLYKKDIIKYYKENYTDDSSVKIALKYPYLRQFVLENDSKF
jgi:hypothetical protein